MDALTAAEFTARQRDKLVSEGIAMGDGTLPIRNETDLRKAIEMWDSPLTASAKQHVEKRARALGKKGLIPEEWLSVHTTTTSLTPRDVADIFEIPLEDIELTEASLTAAAAGLAPVVPPRSWFEVPEPSVATPLTITADGQIYGHAALWGSCHTAFQGRCTQPPRSPSGYEYFHLGELETDDGMVSVGKITMGTGHASLTASRDGAAAHYDNTGTVAAFVRAKDGKHGIWVSGAIRSDAQAAAVQSLRAAAVSGDWRRPSPGKPLEMIGLLAVNVPGFPVPRTQAALAASGMEDHVEALIAAGMPLLTEEEAARQLDVLFSMMDGSLEEQVMTPTELRMSQTAAATPRMRVAELPGTEDTVSVMFDNLTAAFDESKHPRNPGTGGDGKRDPKDGGKFTSGKGGGGGATEQQAAEHANPKYAKLQSENYTEWNERLRKDGGAPDVLVRASERGAKAEGISGDRSGSMPRKAAGDLKAGEYFLHRDKVYEVSKGGAFSGHIGTRNVQSGESSDFSIDDKVQPLSKNDLDFDEARGTVTLKKK